MGARQVAGMSSVVRSGEGERQVCSHMAGKGEGGESKSAGSVSICCVSREKEEVL